MYVLLELNLFDRGKNNANNMCTTKIYRTSFASTDTGFVS